MISRMLVFMYADGRLGQAITRLVKKVPAFDHCPFFQYLSQQHAQLHCFMLAWYYEA